MRRLYLVILFITFSIFFQSCKLIGWNPFVVGIPYWSHSIEDSKKRGIFIEELEFDADLSSQNLIKMIKLQEAWIEYDAVNTANLSKVKKNSGKNNKGIVLAFLMYNNNMQSSKDFLKKMHRCKKSDRLYVAHLNNYTSINEFGVYKGVATNNIDINQSDSLIVVKLFKEKSMNYKMVFRKK